MADGLVVLTVDLSEGLYFFLFSGGWDLFFGPPHNAGVLFGFP